jgi:hypothetical protein
MNQPNNKPVAEVKISKIVASIWANETEKGTTRYNVTFARLYRTEDGEWKRTDGFGRDDLLVLAKVADQAHSKIVELLANPKDDE